MGPNVCWTDCTSNCREVWPKFGPHQGWLWCYLGVGGMAVHLGEAIKDVLVQDVLACACVVGWKVAQHSVSMETVNGEDDLDGRLANRRGTVLQRSCQKLTRKLRLKVKSERSTCTNLYYINTDVSIANNANNPTITQQDELSDLTTQQRDIHHPNLPITLIFCMS